jgi:hypothetical protein
MGQLAIVGIISRGKEVKKDDVKEKKEVAKVRRVNQL